MGDNSFNPNKGLGVNNAQFFISTSQKKTSDPAATPGGVPLASGQPNEKLIPADQVLKQLGAISQAQVQQAGMIQNPRVLASIATFSKVVTPAVHAEVRSLAEQHLQEAGIKKDSALYEDLVQTTTDEYIFEQLDDALGKQKKKK
jgi:hypothetical protein